MFGSRKKSPNTLEVLQSGKWTSTSCDEGHEWPFHMAAFAPDPWSGPEEYEHNGAIRFDGDFLSEDFCVLEGKYFLVRGVLPIPVEGLDEDFGFGCWSTLSRENFDKYMAGFDSGDYGDDELWTGWLCNRLQGFTESDPLQVWIQPREGRQRPLIRVMEDDQPLAIAQENGISPERVLEIFAHYGLVAS